MRVRIALLSSLIGLLCFAQEPKNVQLHGDRFRPLKYEEMTPEQKTMIDHLFAGPRKGANGPFNVLLRSPKMGDLAAEFGEEARFRSSLPPKLNELAIVMTARFWGAEYEWQAHKRAALQGGMNPALVQAIQDGKRPSSMLPDEEAVYNFANELLTTHKVSDATFKAAKDRFGERGIVDMIGVMGWYQMVSMLLNTDRYPLPEGAKPELH